jgi:hypothetical protein
MEGSSGVSFFCGLLIATFLSAFVGGTLLRRALERIFGVTLVPFGRRNFRVEGADGNKGCLIGVLYVVLNIGLFFALFFAMVLLLEQFS